MTTKENILKVAEEEFAKLGFDALSMNNLVKKIDINKATVYYHFKDKKTLYQEIVKDILIEFNATIKNVFDNNLTGEALFKAYMETVVLCIKKRPSVVSIALRELANYGANVDEMIIPYLEEENRYIKIILDQLDLKEKYKEINPYTLSSLIHGTTREFYVLQMSSLDVGGEDELKHNSEKTLDFISDFISNIILDAIVKK